MMDLSKFDNAEVGARVEGEFLVFEKSSLKSWSIYWDEMYAGQLACYTARNSVITPKEWEPRDIMELSKPELREIAVVLDALNKRERK